MNKKQIEEISKKSIVITIHTKHGKIYHSLNKEQYGFVGDTMKIKTGKDTSDYINTKDIVLIQSVEE